MTDDKDTPREEHPRRLDLSGFAISRSDLEVLLRHQAEQLDAEGKTPEAAFDVPPGTTWQQFFDDLAATARPDGKGGWHLGDPDGGVNIVVG